MRAEQCKKLFEKGSCLAACETSKQKTDAGEINPAIRGTGQALIVFTKPPLPSQPGESVLHHPSSRKNVKPTFIVGFDEHFRRLAFQLPRGRVNHLPRNAILFGSPALQCPGISLVGPDPFQSWKTLAYYVQN
jgi:hypothetical protein